MQQLGSNLELTSHRRLLVQQVREIAELFGFETRNKYQIMSANREPIAFAAEEGQGAFGFLMRQWLGHWRTFNIHIMGLDGRVLLTAHHPFRFFFQRIEVKDFGGRPIGFIQQRFSFFSKCFDVANERGMVILRVKSPLWSIWNFRFEKLGREVAVIQKEWSGLFDEAFTDRDNFAIEFPDYSLPLNERILVVVSSIFIDLLYFEGNQTRLSDVISDYPSAPQ